MGYTTNFSGVINLSRKLTMGEAKNLLLINEEPDNAGATRPDSYLQWVPTVEMDGIIWDQGEKFYNYVEWMVWLCKWLEERGIVANGEIFWQGEETGDTGIITVKCNIPTPTKGRHISHVNDTPLTLQKLADIALEKALKAGE